MSQTVSVRELREHLADYLHAAQNGETITVTSHKKPVARIVSPEQPPEGMPDIPGVRWAKNKPRLSRPISECPVNTGSPLSDWVIENRR